MRKIQRTSRFRRDFRRLKTSEHARHIDESLLTLLNLLTSDAVLPGRYVDHPMKGKFQDCRDCHLRGDLVLVYRKVGDDILELVRIGSHAALEI